MANFDPLNGGVWEPVTIHDDGFGAEGLIFTPPSKAVQFRRMGASFGQELNFSAHFLFAEGQSEGTENLYSGPLVASSDINIISRKEWGADENLRYWSPEIEELLKPSTNGTSSSDPCGDFNEQYKTEVRLSRIMKYGPGGEQLVWPLAYVSKLSKFVVHHTDSELRDITGDKRMDGRDYKAMVQLIYYFHSITRGWGDIGYNYVIDPLGNVYEGRYGGDKVVGAHAKCYNNGSMGIAIIGD